MQRRDFLRVSSGAACLAALGAVAGCTRTPEAGPVLLDPTTLRVFVDDVGIREIGEAYLEHAPREAHVDQLVRALLDDGEGGLVDQEDRAALRQHLDTSVEADFQAGRTVVVDGWVLSVTEARQAALFSLAG